MSAGLSLFGLRDNTEWLFYKLDVWSLNTQAFTRKEWSQTFIRKNHTHLTQRRLRCEEAYEEVRLKALSSFVVSLFSSLSESQTKCNAINVNMVRLKVCVVIPI